MKKHIDVFAWTHEEIPKIDPRIISYRLVVNPKFRLIKQKRRFTIEEVTSKVYKSKKWIALECYTYFKSIDIILKKDGKGNSSYRSHNNGQPSSNDHV